MDRTFVLCCMLAIGAVFVAIRFNQGGGKDGFLFLEPNSGEESIYIEPGLCTPEVAPLGCWRVPDREDTMNTETFSNRGWITLAPCSSNTEVNQQRCGCADVPVSWHGLFTLKGFKRYVSQRDTPVQNTSDNALQFKSAKYVLDLVWKSVTTNDEVQRYTSNTNIKWNVIVERAPWMGSFYERLVGIVKTSLRKAIGRNMRSAFWPLILNGQVCEQAKYKLKYRGIDCPGYMV